MDIRKKSLFLQDRVPGRCCGFTPQPAKDIPDATGRAVGLPYRAVAGSRSPTVLNGGGWICGVRAYANSYGAKTAEHVRVAGLRVRRLRPARRREPYFPAERGMRGDVLPMQHVGSKSPTPLSTVCKPSAPACGMPRRRRRNRAQRR